MNPKWDYAAIAAEHERFLAWYLSKSEIPLLAPRTVLRERYEVKQVIGIGGPPGYIYLARDMHSQDDERRWVALKETFIRKTDHLDRQTRLRDYERKASLVASLDHPCIPKINDWFVDGDRVYLVMEYIQGVTLEDVFSKVCDEGTTLLDEQQVGDWAVQLCEVLDYLHTSGPEPIVFGVLQPSNVMLTFHNQIRLIDFGITKSLYYHPHGGRPVVEGGGYWPPERYTYPDLVNPGSDLYALGASLHQLLTGTDPRLKTPFTFHERLPTQLNPHVSSEMEAIIMKCLEYQVDERWQTAQELRGALRQALKA